MNPLSIGALTFGLTMGGVLVGIWIRTALPEHHVNAESKEAVRIGTGLIATITALILGLVTASAKSSFDEMDAAIKAGAADILTLDRDLARYGPETAEIRAALQDALAGGQCPRHVGSRGVSGGSAVLADHHFHEFRVVRAAEPDCDLDPSGLFSVGSLRDLPDSGDEPAVPRINHAVARSDALCALAHEPVGSWATCTLCSSRCPPPADCLRTTQRSGEGGPRAVRSPKVQYPASAIGDPLCNIRDAGTHKIPLGL